MNILFVCSRNQWRSPTAEIVWKRHPGVSTRSAGTSRNARRSVKIDDLRWADVVCAMEQKHKDRIRSLFPRATEHLRIVVLDIPDQYRYMDPALIAELESAMEAILPPA